MIVGNEPNLNLFWHAAVRRDRRRRGRARLRAAARGDLRRAQGGGLGARRDRRRAGAARRRRPVVARRRTRRRSSSSTSAPHTARAAATAPIMDAFSIHVYGESSRIPPTLRTRSTTTIGIADYPKLVTLLGDAFDGTAQRRLEAADRLRRVRRRDEHPAGKAALYTGREVITTVDEQTQASYYAEAIHAAERQPNVRMLFLFHVVDESSSRGCRADAATPTGARSRASRRCRRRSRQLQALRARSDDAPSPADSPRSRRRRTSTRPTARRRRR